MSVSSASNSLTLAVDSTLAGVDPVEWNELTGSADPFLEHEFLCALEESGAIGEGTGWIPQYLTLNRGARLAAAVAFFLKSDSYGEYIFDWQWAEAYHRARMPYYPKLLVAAPFTPATGPRLLVRAGESFEACAELLVAGLLDVVRARRLSGLHFLFLPERECGFLAERGFLPRTTYQFHWLNRGYRTFEDFVADLRSSKRKQIRKERRQVAEAGVEVEVLTGGEIEAAHIEALWRFYSETIDRKWSQAYLNRRTFEQLGERFRHRLVLVLARKDGHAIAGALNVRKGESLYGRYWGTTRAVPGLHFECCYYRLIEYAIEHGIQVFEAGAQGEHKFLRGFVTRPTYSAHWLADPAGRAAIERFLEAERPHIEDVIRRYNSVSPVKAVRGEPAA